MPEKQEIKIDIKERILLATLEVIRTSGMRGVRHRAVAALADVSLGSTTYHFKSIEDLISSAFRYWHKKIDVSNNLHVLSLEQDIQRFAGKNIAPEQLTEMLYKYATMYLQGQVIDNFDDRKVELAFHNEALRNPQLSQLLLSVWQKEVNRIFGLYQAIGTSSPQEDAEMTFALFSHLEKKAMLTQDKAELALEFQKMKATLKQFIFLMVGKE